jgi:phosphate transport system substrate-binding protein
MSFIRIIAFNIALAVLCGAWLAAAETPTLSYVGSSTVGKFMQQAAEEYSGAQFTMNTKPESGGGENATANGMCDLGGVARELQPHILEAGVVPHLIGRDAIGVVVHADNPVDQLSREQLKGIFTGRITQWREVGGLDIPISVYIVNRQSATRKVFGNAVLGDADYAGDNIETVRPDAQIIQRVATDPGAIGHLSFALLNEAQSVKRIAPDGHKPTADNTNYPITRPLYLITSGPAEGAAKEFIAWAQGSEGQAIIKRNFVGID